MVLIVVLEVVELVLVVFCEKMMEMVVNGGVNCCVLKVVVELCGGWMVVFEKCLVVLSVLVYVEMFFDWSKYVDVVVWYFLGMV